MKVLLLVPKAEQTYVAKMKGLFSKAEVRVSTQTVTTRAELIAAVRKLKVDAVVTNQTGIIKKLAYDEKASCTKYMGSVFKLSTSLQVHSSESTPVLVVDSLKSLFTKSYGRFLMGRYIKKLTHPKQFTKPTNKFSHSLLTPTDTDGIAKFRELLDKSLFVAIDIETMRPYTIRCVGYSFVYFKSGRLYLENIVIPTTSLDALLLVREANAHPIRKAFQNGKYDISYFYLYNCPVNNYVFDTINMHHSWYSELPKTLDVLAGFYCLDFRYWKGDHSTGNLADLYEYNARDVWYTALVVIQWLKEAPKWAKNNYSMEFTMVAPSFLMELTGLKLDRERFDEVDKELEAKIEEKERALEVMTATPNFNPGSPKQCKELIKCLTSRMPDSSDAKTMQAVAQKHPLNARILDAITTCREDRKARSSYVKESMIFKDPTITHIHTDGIVLYAINPHGTDTGRLASKEHHYWTGLQIQNIPSGGRIKEMFLAYEGYEITEADYAQAESRGTAYTTGDLNLLEAVNNSPDFHSYNASRFFGVPFEEIYDTQRNKVLNPALRKLSKPVNHGANYNMGDWMLIVQMGGEQAMYKAANLLGLPRNWTALTIANHLLDSFDAAYPKVRNDYHDWVITTVLTTRKLVGATGWVRYCFGQPDKHKPSLNSYVAHCPQSLNAMILNKAVKRVFYNIWWNNSADLLLNAQIHDSILFQTATHRPELREQVRDEMIIPTDVTDITGNTRTMTVPVDLSPSGKRWSDIKD